MMPILHVARSSACTVPDINSRPSHLYRGRREEARTSGATPIDHAIIIAYLTQQNYGQYTAFD